MNSSAKHTYCCPLRIVQTKRSRRSRILIASKKAKLRIYLTPKKRKILKKLCWKTFLLFQKYTIFSLVVAETKPPSVFSRKYLNKIDEVSTLDCLFKLDKIIKAVTVCSICSNVIIYHKGSFEQWEYCRQGVKITICLRLLPGTV